MTISVHVPDNGRIWLTLVGDENEPLDLTPYAAGLLRIGQEGSRSLSDSSDQVDFATLHICDGVRFLEGSDEIPTETALSLLADAVVQALILSVDGYVGSNVTDV
jgi:phage terminase large subunit GpA-like protein